MQRAVALVAVTACLSGLGVNSSPHPVSALRHRAMPQIPGYDFAGCYTEANGARALTGSSYFDDQMTIQKCAAACSGFKYFGVEYSRECYCGNMLNAGSVETQLSECSFTCPGDATQNCGAGNRLDMYIRSAEVTPPPIPTTYSYSGCYAEPASGRALTGQTTGTNDMTVEKCASFCGNAGYSYFGLEYYYECYCGNSLAPDAQSAPEADCKYPCVGDATQKCGGDWRFNLYQFGSATASSSSSSSTSSATPTPSAGVSTYASEGCYTEATEGRALSDVSYYDDALTVEKCAAVCSTYTWFGLEYGRECYCGNTINYGSVQAPLSDCSFNCAGNSSQKCGAGNRLNLYSYLPVTTSSSSPIEPSTTSTTEPTTVESSTVSTSETSTSAAEPTSLTSTEPSTTVAASETSTEATTESSTMSTAGPISSSAEPSTTASTAAESTSSSTSTSATGESSTSEPSSTSSSTSSSSMEMTTSTSISSSIELTASSSLSSSSTTEPTTSSSSSTSAEPTTSSSSTSTVAPLPTQAITNGGFEQPGGWTIKTSAPGVLTYSFTNPSDPHGGLQSASVAYTTGAASYQAWFSQPITLRPNKRYLFSGFAKSTVSNPGCAISYYIGTNNGNQNLKTLATITSANLRPSWVTSTGFYDSTSITDLTFNVRWTCTGSAARTYYVDDVSLTTTP